MSHCCTISFDEYKYRKSFHIKKEEINTHLRKYDYTSCADASGTFSQVAHASNSSHSL